MLMLDVKRCCTILAVALIGCTHDSSGLYATAPSSNDAGEANAVAETPLPLLPSRPSDSDTYASCAACAKDKCAAAREHCLEDDDCTDMLACKGKCSDPACLQACEAKLELSAWYDDLGTCVFEQACNVECKAGENFACVGHYNWPVATQSRFPVRFDFGLNYSSTASLRFKSFLVGAEVRACPSSPCTDNNLNDSARVDSTNSVSLDLIGDLAGRFAGFLEIEDARSGFFGARMRVYPEPLARAMELRMVLLDGYALQSQTGGLLDLEAGAPLVIQIVDCLGFGARNVRFELPDLPGVEVGHYGEGVVYGAEATSVGLALVPDVPETASQKQIRGRVVRVGTGEIVAEALVEVRAGWITELMLRPRTR
jgi:hypothetical protein